MAYKKKPISLYDQVKAILNKLQGETMPNYQGLHAFWLDPEVFQTATLYGQKLIAASNLQGNESNKSCCGNKDKPQNSDLPQTPIKSDKGCCGSNESKSETATIPNPATSAVHEPPTTYNVGNCWPTGESSEDIEFQSTSKRSDESAIIIGLKGLYPFDGSIFPRLMWDTTNVATSEDINIIAEWIDKDCPITIEDEQSIKLSQVHPKTNQFKALALGENLHQPSSKKVNEIQNENKDISIRKEISSLNPSELTTFREALGCMMQYTDYWQDERSFDYWARIHTNSCQHGWEQFGPWHRLYLYFFEQMLQDYDSSITLPYWSWTDYSDLNTNTFNNSHYDLGVLPEAYGCYLTKSGLDKLKNTKSSNGKTLFSKTEITGLETIYKKKTVYNSGLRFLTAAGISYGIKNQNNVAIWDEKTSVVYNTLKAINPLWFPNRWPGSMGGATSYPTQNDIDVLLSLDKWSDFGGGPSYDHHFGSLEKVHNGMHNFSGGTNPCYPDNNPEWVKIYTKLGLTANPQSEQNPPYGWMTDNRITAFDPLFWGHHSNVDRIWALWQEKHSGQPEENGALAPWSLTVEDTYSITKLGYCYMKDSVYYDVNSRFGLVKFNSSNTNVSNNTLDTHRKAEIKIHRVRRGNLQNAHIRIFLNSPNANINTPTENNEHFVEQITTFHGSCYGGPGHCSLPLSNTRTFDKRTLHHHEPRNYKIDATKAVQRMLNIGEKDITIQLVIVGINGQPIDNAVYIDGVSLNFMD